MDLKSKKILIAGAGISGIGAAALLGKAGIPAAIYDGNEALDQEAVAAKLPEGMEVSFELGEFKEELADKLVEDMKLNGSIEAKIIGSVKKKEEKYITVI